MLSLLLEEPCSHEYRLPIVKSLPLMAQELLIALKSSPAGEMGSALGIWGLFQTQRTSEQCRDPEPQLWGQINWASSSALPLISWVSLHKYLKLPASVNQSVIENNNTTSWTVFARIHRTEVNRLE